MLGQKIDPQTEVRVTVGLFVSTVLNIYALCKVCEAETEESIVIRGICVCERSGLWIHEEPVMKWLIFFRPSVILLPFPSPITSSAGFSFLRALDVEVAQVLHLGLPLCTWAHSSSNLIWVYGFKCHHYADVSKSSSQSLSRAPHGQFLPGWIGERIVVRGG